MRQMQKVLRVAEYAGKRGYKKQGRLHQRSLPFHSMEVIRMKTKEKSEMDDVFGPVIYAYTRAQAIEDGVLVDVSKLACEAGIKFPTAVTSAVFHEYVETPPELKGLQDDTGRLWDIVWMLSFAIRSGRIEGAQGTFEVIIAKPDKGDWQSNEKPHEGDREKRLVTLKAVCGPSDDGSACITVMRPEED